MQWTCEDQQPKRRRTDQYAQKIFVHHDFLSQCNRTCHRYHVVRPVQQSQVQRLDTAFQIGHGPISRNYGVFVSTSSNISYELLEPCHERFGFLQIEIELEVDEQTKKFKLRPKSSFTNDGLALCGSFNLT